MSPRLHACRLAAHTECKSPASRSFTPSLTSRLRHVTQEDLHYDLRDPGAERAVTSASRANESSGRGLHSRGHRFGPTAVWTPAPGAAPARTLPRARDHGRTAVAVEGGRRARDGGPALGASRSGRRGGQALDWQCRKQGLTPLGTPSPNAHTARRHSQLLDYRPHRPRKVDAG